MKLLPFFFSIILLGTTIIAQENIENWVETEATILEVHKSIKAKGTHAYATVAYKDIEGNVHKTRVRLMAIPLIGSLKSVNDTMTVFYNPNKPMIAKSPSSSFLESYGLYIFIALGVLFSLRTIKKMMSARAKGTT